jgi:hypothetical protein
VSLGDAKADDFDALLLPGGDEVPPCVTAFRLDPYSDAVLASVHGAGRSLVQDVALATALTPLLGFVECFGSQVALPFRSWCEQVAEYACAIAADTRNSGAVRKDKGFDDPIESGLAFLTAVSFVAGFSHTWGDGSDGTIVGPGLLRGGAARRWSSTRRFKAAGSSR